MDSIHPRVHILGHTPYFPMGFKKWKRNVNHLWQLLLYIRRSFYKVEVPNIELASNKEAARLWEEDKPLFEAEAEKCVKDWETRIYNTTSDDPHFIRARKSFMKPGSMEIFSDMMREVTGIENSLPNQ